LPLHVELRARLVGLSRLRGPAAALRVELRARLVELPARNTELRTQRLGLRHLRRPHAALLVELQECLRSRSWKFGQLLLEGAAEVRRQELLLLPGVLPAGLVGELHDEGLVVCEPHLQLLNRHADSFRVLLCRRRHHGFFSTGETLCDHCELALEAEALLLHLVSAYLPLLDLVHLLLFASP